MQSDQVERDLRARSCCGYDQTAPGGRRPPFGVRCGDWKYLSLHESV